MNKELSMENENIEMKEGLKDGDIKEDSQGGGVNCDVQKVDECERNRKVGFDEVVHAPELRDAFNFIRSDPGM